MKKYLLLFVCLLVTTWAGATVTANYSGGTLTLTVDGTESDQITVEQMNTISTEVGNDWQYVTKVVVTGSSYSVTSTDVANIAAKVTTLTWLDLSGVASCESLSNVTCSTLRTLILPKGTSLDANEFGRASSTNLTTDKKMLVTIVSPSSGYYNVMLVSPKEPNTPFVKGDIENALSSVSEIHLTVVGDVSGDNINVFSDFVSNKKFYLNLTAATGDVSGDASTVTFSRFQNSLYRIIFPSTMTIIPEGCLSGCSNLESVKIPEGVTEIKAEAFNNCQKLTTVNLPSTLKTIGNKAFYLCHNILSLRIPEGVTNIGKEAFRECLHLTSIVLPSTLAYIGDDAFSNCNYLKDIYLKGPAPLFTTDGTIATARVGGSLVTPRSLDNNDLLKPNPNASGFNTDNVKQSDYWSSSFSDNNTNVLTMLHVQKAYAYDYTKTDGTLYTGYTVKDRYETPSSSLYYKYDASDYTNSLVRYPDETNLKYVEGIEGGTTYTGWKAFALVDLGYVPSDHEKQVPNLKDATWYTLCYPFKMTRAMIEDTFGSGTEVCNFVGVTKAKSGTTETRTIHFTSDLINPGYDTDGNLITPATTDIIEANHPYMIHPSVAPETRTTTASDGTTTTTTAYYVRTDYNLGDAYKANFGTPTSTPETYYGTDQNSTADNHVSGYYFEGNYTEQTMPTNVFYLGTSNGEDVFKYITQTNVNRKCRAFTAVINPPAGTQITGAKMSLAFDEEENGKTTGITDVQATATKAIATKYVDKVFNMQGQVVRAGSSSLDGLDKGIYIVNGKKIVVR